ncbi:MAG: FAD-dependent oxidoreductase [Maricaulaceae bacterium]|nr:FAD-dependent oxidoreductase [Maricaulaceae bacterium]
MTKISSSGPSTPRVAIIGGGAIGLACALELARRGAAVTVFEAGPRAGEGALRASGGMLAGGFEGASGTEARAFADFAARSLTLWDEWAAMLAPHAPSPLGYRRAGSLSPAFRDDDLEWLQRLDVSGVERLMPKEARRLEPSIAPDIRGALLFPEDGELDNRVLGPALAAAIRAEGGVIRESAPVETLLLRHGRAAGVRALGRAFEADMILAAPGAQAPTLREIPETQLIAPVQGEMLALAPGAARLNRAIRGRHVYLTQKPDGRIVAGATARPGVANLAVRSQAVDALRRAAIETIPALGGSEVIETWAGLRPASPDGAPVIGWSALPGVFLALGHHRNGVLLAPATAEAAAAAILDVCDTRFHHTLQVVSA